MFGRCVVLIPLLLLGLCLWRGEAFARHGHWIDHYTSALGGSCCGQRDCIRVAMRVMALTPESATIEVNGVLLTIPRLSLHASEDAMDYLCVVERSEPPSAQNTRCAFVAPGS